MQQKTRIIFFGSSKFVIPIIEVLYKNFDLVFVVTTEKNPTDSVPSYCIKNKIPYISASNLSDPNLKSSIINLKSPIATLAYFGLIIPKNILDAFPKGIFNIHPSLLPKYRGPTPVQTTILNGDKTTGVTIIKLDEQIDHGKIFVQKSINTTQNDTTSSLHEKLFTLGSEMLTEVINEYLAGKLKPKEQDHQKATFTKSLTRQDGFIDLHNPLSKEKLDRMIRAYHPWPGVWTRLRLSYGGQAKFKVVKFLPEKKIQVEGKKPMSYKDFINGYPELRPVMLNLFQHLKS